MTKTSSRTSWLLNDIRQIYALALKDITLQFRQWKSNCCQICTPILCMLFLLLLQVMVDEVILPLVDSGDDDGRPVYARPMDLGGIILKYQKGNNLTVLPDTILYSSAHGPNTDYMGRIIPTRQKGLFSFAYNDNDDDIDETIFDSMEEEKENEDVVNEYLGAYKIRHYGPEFMLDYVLEHEITPERNEQGRENERTEFCEDLEDYSGGWCRQGIGIGLMDLLHSEYVKNATNGEMTIKTYASHQPYYVDFEEAMAINVVELMGSFIYPLILLLGIPTIMYSIVLEKETQLKEMMKLMGLKERNYVISTFCFKYFWFLLSLFLFIVLGLILQQRLFFQTNWLVLIPVFLGIGLQVVTTGFFCASFISSSFVATIVGYLLVLFVPLSGVFLIQFLFKPGLWYFKPLLFFPTFPVVDVLYHMNMACSKYMCLEPADFGENIDFLIGFCFLFLDSALFFVAGLYLEKVAKQKWGIRKHPCFCLNWMFTCCCDFLEFIFVDTWCGKYICFRKAHKGLGANEPKKSKIDEFAQTDEDPDVTKARNKILLGGVDQKDYGILVKGLVKQFGSGRRKNIAVKKVCLGIGRKECFGLLGPNGAGKSTLMNVLSGIFGPSAGTAFLGGYDLRNDIESIRQKLGLCPQFTVCWPELTPSEHLLFYARLKGVSMSEEEPHVADILDKVGLKNSMKKFFERNHHGYVRNKDYETEKGLSVASNQPMVDDDEDDEDNPKRRKKMSKWRIWSVGCLWRILRTVLPIEKTAKSLNGGMKRRLGIAIALCGHPDIILLDEPTTGLDATNRREVWDVILNEKKGKCVVLTTHSMEEADVLSDRIGIMSHGRLVALGSALHLKEKYGNGYTLLLKAKEEGNTDSIVEYVDQKFSDVCQFQLISKFGEKLTYQLLPLESSEDESNEEEEEIVEKKEEVEEEKSVESAAAEDESGVEVIEILSGVASSTSVSRVSKVTNDEDPSLSGVEDPSVAEAESVGASPSDAAQEENTNKRENGTTEMLVLPTGLPNEEGMSEEGVTKQKGVLRISGVFEKLETEKESLGIVDFELNQTTLEDVFLNVIRSDEEKIISERQQKTNWEELGIFKKNGEEAEGEGETNAIGEDGTSNEDGEDGESEESETDEEKVSSSEEEIELEDKEKPAENTSGSDSSNSDDSEEEENEGGESQESNSLSESSSTSGEEGSEQEEEEAQPPIEEGEKQNSSSSSSVAHEEDNMLSLDSQHDEDLMVDVDLGKEDTGHETDQSNDLELGNATDYPTKVVDNDESDEETSSKAKKPSRNYLKDNCLYQCFFGIVLAFMQSIFLMQKNCILTCRSWKSSCFLIISPFFIVLIIFLTALIVDKERPEWYVHADYDEVDVSEIEPCTAWGENDCYTLAYSTDGNEFAQKVMNDIVATHGLAFGDDYLIFESKTLLESFMFNNPNRTQTAVSFSNRTIDPMTGLNQTTYTLYFNGTEDMDNYVVPFKIIIDNTILKLSGSNSRIRMEEQGFGLMPGYSNLNGQKTIFMNTGPSYFSLLSSMIFIVALFRIVFEKEHGLRDGLEMIGMKKFAYFSSWLCNFIIFGVLMTLVTMISGYIFVLDVFVYSNPVFMFTIFFVFILTQIFLAFVLSTLLSKTKSALIMGFIILAIGFILNMFIASGSFTYLIISLEDEFTFIPYILQVLYPPFNFGKLFADVIEKTIKVYDHSENKFVANTGYWTFEDMFSYNDVEAMRMEFTLPPSFLSIVYLILNCIIFFVLFLYLDIVCNDGAGCCFCLNPFYYLNKCCGCGWTCRGCCCGACRKCLSKGMEMSQGKNIGEDEDIIDEAQEAKNMKEYLPLRIIGVKKTYNSGIGKRTKAVRGVDLCIPPHQVLGLLGPNGAGKSTTLASVAGVVRNDAGEIYVDEMNTKSDRTKIRPRLGVTLQHNILWDDLTAAEHVRLFCQIKGILNPFEWKRQIKKRLQEVSLYDVRNDCSKTFSGGMKRRLSVALAGVGTPNVMLLDEPSTGLDPFSKREVWKLIKDKCSKKECTLLLTTHSMEECDTLSNKIAIMSEGKVRCVGDSMRLKSKYGSGYMLKISCVSEKKEDKFVLWIKKLFPGANSFEKRNTCSYMLNFLPEQVHELISGIKRIEDNMYMDHHRMNIVLFGEDSVSGIHDFPLNKKTMEVNYQRNMSVEEMSSEAEEELRKDGAEGEKKAIPHEFEENEQEFLKFYPGERLVKNFGLSNTTLEDVYLSVTKEMEEEKESKVEEEKMLSEEGLGEEEEVGEVKVVEEDGTVVVDGFNISDGEESEELEKKEGEEFELKGEEEKSEVL